MKLFNVLLQWEKEPTVLDKAAILLEMGISDEGGGPVMGQVRTFKVS